MSQMIRRNVTNAGIVKVEENILDYKQGFLAPSILYEELLDLMIRCCGM